jgi:hypothetical protein
MLRDKAKWVWTLCNGEAQHTCMHVPRACRNLLTSHC